MLAVAPLPSSPSWQLMPDSHSPWLLVAATKLTPSGSASTRLTAVAVAGPLFVTTSV